MYNGKINRYTRDAYVTKNAAHDYTVAGSEILTAEFKRSLLGCKAV
jgi:hypothetical protein